MLFFGLGGLFYGQPSPLRPSNASRSDDEADPNTVSILLTNAIAILSEDRFLARSTHSHSGPSMAAAACNV